jgi:uncharacterized repeat protein (TIGR01451 family)
MNYRSAHTAKASHRDKGGRNHLWLSTLLLLALTLGTIFAQSSATFAQQEGVWSGVVTDREGNPQAALVSINGVSIQTDESGRFELMAPVAAEARNVVNTEVSGYGLTSLIIKRDAPIQDLRIQINPAQVNIFEPGQFIEVKDERGTVVTIEPDALVDEAGNPPQSPLQVQLYTYAILEGEIIGDQSAIAIDGEEVQLRTFGMIDIQIVDDKGQRYNLRPGAIATISMPVLDVENDPDTVGLWDFDTNRGLWIEEEGVARREGDRFVGQTPRLGGKNLDIRRPALPTPLTCQANEVLTVLRAGEVDAFAPGPDTPPATPNAALVAHLNTVNLAIPILGFDEPVTTSDYWFAHSFDLTGLAPNITAAMVEFAARPSLSWLANNDTAWVGFTNTAIWSSALGAGVGLPWTNANYPAGQLFRTPAFAGSDVVAMNSNQFLDFVVQDDSAVDYVTLLLCIKQPDLTLQKSANPSVFQAGTTADYTLTVSNIGVASTSATIYVTDTLPAGLTFASVSAPAPWSCSFVAPTLACSHPGPVAPGATLTLTVQVKVDAAAVPTVRNCATVRTAGEAEYNNNESCVQNDVKPALCTTPTFISEVLSSNRWSALPNNRLQAVLWYDGNGTQATLKVEYRINATTTGWLTIGQGFPGGPIDAFGTQIETREYDLCGYTLTGRVTVNRVVANGVIDGLAFGLYTKDATGRYDLWQSWSTAYNTVSDYVGMWPVGVGDGDFAARTPQLNAAPLADQGYIRQTARMILTSAKYLGNGTYQIKPERAVATTRLAGRANCGLTHVTNNLQSNRGSGLPTNTLQVAAWYDGTINPSTPPRLRIEYIDPATRAIGWITIGQGFVGGPIDPFGAQIETRQYNLGSCQLTGVVDVRGNVANGMVDGLAFGLYTKNAGGQYKLCQSRAATLNSTSDFVGGWPLGLDDGTFAARATDVTDWFARQQGMTTIMSAQYAQDGRYNLCNYRGYFPAIGTAAVSAAGANGVNVVDDAETVALVNPDTDLINDDLFLDPTASSEQTVPAVVPTACTDSEGFCAFGEAAPDNWLEYDGTQLGNNDLRLRIFLPVASR